MLNNEIDIGKYNRATDRLYELNFYLSQAQCDEINKKRLEVENFIMANKLTLFCIVRDDIKPDPKFDESYLD